MSLAPPLTPAQYLGIVSSTYAKFGPRYNTPEAQLMCVATALQETPLQTRVQRVRHALERGEAVIVFDAESSQCQLAMKRDVPKEWLAD